MIEYEYSLFNLLDVQTSTRQAGGRWHVRMKHKPTGLFAESSGVGKFEHQIDARRECFNDLKTQVDTHYRNEYEAHQ